MIQRYLDSRVLRRFPFLLIFGAMVIALPLAAHAQSVIGFDDLDGTTNRLSLSIVPLDTINGPGDMFGIRDRSTIVGGFGLPFAMSDDSVVGAAGNSVFAPDNQGIFGQAKTDKFFGVVDTVNNNNATGTGTATWTFSIAGFSNLGLQIDIGGQGDFEEPQDIFRFRAKIDGGAFQTIFNFEADEPSHKFYRPMDSGLVPFDNDPLVELIQSGSRELNKSDPATGALDIFSGPIAGSGNVLTLEFFAVTNGGDEAVAFDNIKILESVLDIDIKPGSDPNAINLQSQGRTPVAILSTDDFDALTIDPSTVLFGGAGGASPIRSHTADVNEDGLTDLLLKFDTPDVVAAGALSLTSLTGLITGETFGGGSFGGSDSVKIVPKGDANKDQIVNAADYTIWANNFGTVAEIDEDGDIVEMPADFNENGIVDAADYTIWADEFGTDYTGGSGSQGGSAAAVPEPSTFLLACCGLIALLGYGRRRRR